MSIIAHPPRDTSHGLLELYKELGTTATEGACRFTSLPSQPTQEGWDPRSLVVFTQAATRCSLTQVQSPGPENEILREKNEVFDNQIGIVAEPEVRIPVWNFATANRPKTWSDFLPKVLEPHPQPFRLLDACGLLLRQQDNHGQNSNYMRFPAGCPPSKPHLWDHERSVRPGLSAAEELPAQALQRAHREAQPGEVARPSDGPR